MNFTLSAENLQETLQKLSIPRLSDAILEVFMASWEDSLDADEPVISHSYADQKESDDKILEDCARDKDYTTALSIFVGRQTEEYEFQSRLSYTNIQTEEDTVSEITENKVDRRIFNGRKAEYELCESLTDTNVMQLMEECHQEVMHRKLGHSRYTRMFLCDFTISLYKFVDEKWDTYAGKIAHMHRVVKDRIGEMLGFGVRQFQKSIAWFKNFTTSSHESDNWAEREERTYAQWCDLKDEIEEFLKVRIPQMVAVN